MGIVAATGMTFSLYLENISVLVTLSTLTAFTVYPILPTSVELGCELVYPIGEVNYIILISFLRLLPQEL